MSNIQDLELQKLKAQLAEIEAAISSKQAEEVKVLVDGFAKKLNSLDLSIESAIRELQKYAPGRKRRAEPQQIVDDFVLYANPANPKQTWGGIDPPPAWVKDYLEKGGRLDSIKV